MESYKPCLEPIRAALSAPSDTEKQRTAFQALIPNVLKIAEFYEVVNDAAALVPRFLAALSAPMALAEEGHLAAQLLELLNTMYSVDQKKMLTPGIQNDFSFYRRSVGKFPSEAPVKETDANQISMWIAEATPVAAAISGCLKKENKKNPALAATLAKVANACAWMVAKDPALGRKDKDILFVAMTEAIVLMDRGTVRGAFFKESGVMMRKCLKTLTAEEHAEGSEVVMGCKNAIKFSTVHFGDASTPAFVEELME